MEIPKTVYHGTFWPDDREKPISRLKTDNGYICTSEFLGKADFFARLKRVRYKDKPGMLLIYAIDTQRLPADLLVECIPPDGVDPRALKDAWIMKMEESMRSERIRIREWRFPYVPLSAVINLEETHLDADPRLTIFNYI